MVPAILPFRGPLDVHTARQTVLGHTFSLPFFIAPAANAGLAHPRGELNLVEAAGKGGILYAPSLSATQPMEEIARHARPGQVVFHQLYVSANRTKLLSDLRRIEAGGYKAIFVTVDNPIHGIRPREARYGFSNVTDHDPAFSWRAYAELRQLTKLPVIPKGIQTVEDAKRAVAAGAPAIYVSNHGGRQLDSAQAALETLLEIHTHAPDVFRQTEVFADGGVRYGTDVLKMLALGVKMVGLGRPFMFANVFGVDGVSQLIEILRRELWIDAGNLGVTNMQDVDTRYVSLPIPRCV